MHAQGQIFIGLLSTEHQLPLGILLVPKPLRTMLLHWLLAIRWVPKVVFYLATMQETRIVV